MRRSAKEFCQGDRGAVRISSTPKDSMRSLKTSVYAIAIAEQETRRCLPRERFGDLLGGPVRGRVLGDVEVDDAAPVVGEHDEDEQDLEGDCGDHEEVDRHEVLHVVLEEGPPRGRGWLPQPDHVLLDGGLGDLDAKLGELPDDPW